MAWTAPKKNWYGKRLSNGAYSGDRFNYSDYNRIKNNITEVYNIAFPIYPDLVITDMGNDKKVTDFLYAEDINAFESNIDAINKYTKINSVADMLVFNENGQLPDYNEFNRIESDIETLYNYVSRFVIRNHPKTVTVTNGTTVTFNVLATGIGLTYQWQYRRGSSGDWLNNSSTSVGYNTSAMQIPGTSGRNGWQYRCKVTNSSGSILYSNVATLNVTA